MINRFLHIGFGFAGVPRMLDLEPVFSAMGGDWIRYSKTTWILWSTLSPVEVMARLQPHIDQDDQVLIAPFLIQECWGSLPPWMWTWMSSKVPGSGVTFGDDVRAQLKYIPPPPPKTPFGA